MKDKIISFPAFSRDWSAAPIQQVLVGVFMQQLSRIVGFSLYIDTLSDIERLRQYVVSISGNFPEISHLELYVKDPRVDKVSSVFIS
jgi:hypothetical protein